MNVYGMDGAWAWEWGAVSHVFECESRAGGESSKAMERGKRGEAHLDSATPSRQRGRSPRRLHGVPAPETRLARWKIDPKHPKDPPPSPKRFFKSELLALKLT